MESVHVCIRWPHINVITAVIYDCCFTVRTEKFTANISLSPLSRPYGKAVCTCDRCQVRTHEITLPTETLRF